MADAGKECDMWRGGSVAETQLLGPAVHTGQHGCDTDADHPALGFSALKHHPLPFAYDSQGWGIWIPLPPNLDRRI